MVRTWKYVSAILDVIIGLGMIYLGLLRFLFEAPEEFPIITNGQKLWEFSILFAHEFWFIIIPMGITALSLGIYKFFILKEEKLHDIETVLSDKGKRGLA